MGTANPQRAFFYEISLETFVPADHPLRSIRPLIDDAAVSRSGRGLASPDTRTAEEFLSSLGPALSCLKKDIA